MLTRHYAVSTHLLVKLPRILCKFQFLEMGNLDNMILTISYVFANYQMVELNISIRRTISQEFFSPILPTGD